MSLKLRNEAIVRFTHGVTLNIVSKTTGFEVISSNW
jgi:hypothetical protein